MLLAAPALFASNMVAARWAHDAALPPVFLAFGRWLLAFLILLPLAAPALLRHRQALWRGLPTLLPLAVLGMGVAVAPQYIGAQSTSATNIALIFSCSPILVALDVYKRQVRACVQPGVAYPPPPRSGSDNPTAQYRVQLGSDGKVNGVTLTSSCLLYTSRCV